MKSLCLAAASLAVAGTAQVAYMVVHQLDWLPGGDKSPIYVCIHECFCADAGLELSVEPGRGSSEAITKIATGDSDVGSAGLGALMINVPTYLLPAPSRIVTGYDAVTPGRWFQHISSTLRVALIGYGVSIQVSLPIAIGLAKSAFLSRAFYPLLVVIQSVPGERIVDASGCVVVPGLVNTHHHLFHPVLKGVPAGMNARLNDWLMKVPFTYWPMPDAEALRVSASIGMAEPSLTGATAVADHHYIFSNRYDYDSTEVLFEVDEALGMRFVFCRGGGTKGRVFDDPSIPPPPIDSL